MKLVSITDEHAATMIDPREYLAHLPQLAPSMPAGAHAFATDPDHYDFFGKRCVKDLKLAGMAIDNSGDETTIEISLRHNCWKHEDDLNIRYSGVHDLEINIGVQSKWLHIDLPVILDEILPHPHGCSHEIALHGGTILITCRDLTATWTEAYCPDKKPAAGGSQ
ncbi:MAG TPA: hypothetical protein DGT23_01385 [Micromonosporaceae bacterium]|nr:hypothetical protein [Micromonosporaceae bacterium]